MAETLISPGVLARENDQSQITQGPREFGAAIIGPSVKGPIEVPTVVTSYSEYLATFGGSVISGSQQYSYLNQIAANNYFRQGGSSLLVTRVASGSFTSAVSKDLLNNVESGVIALSTLSVGSGGSGGSADTFTDVATTTSGNGIGATVTVVTNTGNGKILTSVDALLSSITTPTTDADDDTYSTSPTGGTGDGLVVSVVVSSNAITSITATSAGSGYAVNDEITIPSSVIGGTTDVVITLEAGDLLVEVSSITVTNGGSGYAIDDTLTVDSSNIGTSTANLVTSALTAGDIINSTPFVLSTISEGTVMNNSGSELSGGALVSGSKDNVRWEITNVNTSSGVFSLAIRRGDDTHNQKSILETFNNISLDPLAANYIESAIGNTYHSIEQDGSDFYLKSNGNYENKSRYVYVSSITSATPNYFDNNGTAKSELTSSLPTLGSGSFGSGTGNLFEGGAAKFNENIDSNNTQGVSPNDYTSSINLLSNKDDYKFNVLTAPGLIHANHSTVVNSLISTAEARQDCIAVIDLRGYDSTVGQVTNAVSGFDSSYAATYWPWLQMVDPDTARTIWVPASTLIPGVFAYTDSSSDPWFAPAGLTRGGLGQVVKAERKLTSGNRDTLYEANVNPIATFPQSGVVVFGQKTLQKKSTALDRVNVRRLLIALKGFIGQVADNLVFEQNTIATRNNFLTQVNPYLESVQQRQGLYAFKVVMDDSNNTPDVIDRNELLGQIYLQPTKTAEFIVLDFNVLPTGATFPA
jgi:phage tail sheath protein FI